MVLNLPSQQDSKITTGERSFEANKSEGSSFGANKSEGSTFGANKSEGSSFGANTSHV